MFTAYVRPKLEHISPVGLLDFRKCVDLLEKLHRREVSYKERTAAIDLPNLEERGIRGDIKTSLKVLS